jgi:hypothetical protein
MMITCKTLKKVKFYTINLPLILITIPMGFLFELIVTFPFIICCTIDNLNSGRTLSKKPE